jgi:hypothetical protein
MRSSVPSSVQFATEHKPEDDCELLAFACWTLDKVAKSYLRACWKLRLAMLDKLRVKCEPSYGCVTGNLKQKHDERRPATLAWLAQRNWRRTGGPQTRNKSSRKIKRDAGLFYKLSDCM